jgi:hypothetical protein
LDALHYAHNFNTEEGNELEIVHRDVSPDNVLVSNRGYVNLLDFGIASIRGPQAQVATQTGGFRGKLCYSAPETVMGEQATPRSDQYSAAVVLLEMLTGVTPFQANSVAETFMKMVSDVPAPPSATRPDLPPGLDDVLATALSKDPLQRFDSALAFSRELRRLQSRDDDEISEQLRELVEQDFELMPAVVQVESLRDRQAALEKLMSIAPGPALPVAGPTKTNGGAVLLNTGEAATILGAAAVSPITVRQESRQLRGLLWGLLVVGGLIAVGLGATVAVLSRKAGDGAEQQVLVVGGGRETQGESADLVTDDGASVAAGVEATGSAVGRGTGSVAVDPLATSAARGASRSPAAGAAERGAGQAQLASAVQQKSGSFQTCFVRNLGVGQAASEAVLHFDVAKSGGAAQVEVEPSSVANTPLGQCLKKAGRSVRFPALDQPVSFRVPVRARVTRASGK